MKILYFLIASFLVLGGVGAAHAQEEESEPVKDYFQFAAEVHVPEQGARDVVAFGPIVDINKPVEQDVLAAGGTVIIQSDVAGDVRLAGSRVVIDGSIGGNAAIAAQNVEIRPGATIAGDATIYAESLVFEGAIGGDAEISAKSFLNNGTIGGELSHKTFVPPSQEQRSPLAWFFRVVSLFGMLVVGLVLVSLFPKSMRQSVHASIKNPLHDVLWGLGVLIVTPVAALVLALTIIGIPFALLLVALYMVAVYLAKIAVGLVLGTYLYGAFRGRARAEKVSLLWIMVLGVFAVWLITGIPAIGGIITFVATIWGLGVLVRLRVSEFKKMEL